MALGFNNAPVNWQIDYGQLRSGEYMGNALANTGDILGNAIVKATMAQEKKRKEKEANEAATRFIGKKYGMSEEDAKDAVKGIGLENFLQIQQYDQQQQLLQQRALASERQAQQAIWERNSLIQSVLKSYHPQGGPASIMPAGGVTGNAQFPGGSFDQNIFFQDALRSGVDPRTAADVGESIHKFLPKPAQPRMAQVTRKEGDITASYSVPLTDLERAFLPARQRPPEPVTPPMADVTQRVGNTTVRRKVPAQDAEGELRKQEYRSPYAQQIADLNISIARHQAAMTQGDNRTGPLNLRSRQKQIDEATQQLLRLQAMEIQDQLAKGVISEEEADRRADLLMATR